MCPRINDTAFTPPRGFRYETYSQQTNLETKPAIWHKEKEAEILPGLPEDAVPGNGVIIDASLADITTMIVAVSQESQSTRC